MIQAIWLPKLDSEKDNLLGMNGLKPSDGGTEFGFRCLLPHPFFGFVDSKGHSRFVLRISIFAVSPLPFATSISVSPIAVRPMFRAGSTLSQNGQAMETDETHYFAKARGCRALGAGSRTPRNAVSARP